MDSLLVILLVIAGVKFIVFGVILWKVFRQDIKHWWTQERRQKSREPSTPVCVYCQSVWTVPVDEGQTRWEGDELVLVTTFECQHCQLPFWRVERLAVHVAGK